LIQKGEEGATIRDLSDGAVPNRRNKKQKKVLSKQSGPVQIGLNLYGDIMGKSLTEDLPFEIRNKGGAICLPIFSFLFLSIIAAFQS